MAPNALMTSPNSFVVIAPSLSLSNKYKTTNQTYNTYLIEILIRKKRGHILAQFKDMEIYNFIQEYHKRFYHSIESIIKIPKFAIYYKNYSLFFCRPTLADQVCNKIMNKHMEKIAQIFFDQNYVKKENKKIELEKEKTEINIFNQGVIEEIEIDEFPKKKNIIQALIPLIKSHHFLIILVI